jgi:putative Holliday junction resolvase
VNDRVLGFDYGTKKIGVAVGNRITNTTQPLKPVFARNSQPNWQDIDALIIEWKPGALVVGLPLNLDGSSGEMALKAGQFADTLKTRHSIPVALIDERLSSSEADALIKETILPGKSATRKRKNTRDSVAAELILRTYLTDNSAPV